MDSLQYVMPCVIKPYRRIIRPFIQTGYRIPELEDSYLTDVRYAPDRVSLIRAYNTIEHDLIRLFEYVEPADGNLPTYSHRLYELLLRASTELEANCKGILDANGYRKSGDLRICDYHKINECSRLSDYELAITIWYGGRKVLQPFQQWSNDHTLSWYQAYNCVKHDRSTKFELANLDNVLLAVSAVFAVLFSQFYVLSFRGHVSVGVYHLDDGWYSHANSIFAIKPPNNWPDEERYQFDWPRLRENREPYDKYFAK